MMLVVRNGCKSYSDGIPVLKQLSLNVKAGSIYGLLGESGSGKSTLLSCIVGLSKLDSGDIYVNGSTPGTKGSNISGLGFMPQLTSSLPMHFTIRQTLWFFGKIYGMKEKRIEERIQFFSEFLKLSDTSKLIQNLSGGQLRRVSLSVAMIHEPQLLILDEPTVGLDPLLRQSIWEHLLVLVTRDRKTVLFTTHYSEEAKFCGTIGILRRGRLISEESPDQLLLQTNSLFLEKAIVQLCRRDEEGLNIVSQNLPELDYVEQDAIESSSIWDNINIVYAMLYRHLLIYRKKPMLLEFQTILPLLNIFLASYMGADPKGLTLGFVNNDWNYLNQTEVLTYCKNKRQIINLTCFSGGIETFCSFLNQFEENEITWVTKSSEKEALISVQNGNSVGYLAFPSNFSRHLEERLLFRGYSQNETIIGSSIKIRMDMTNSISKTWLIEKLFEKYFAFVNTLLTDCQIDSRFVQIPLKYNAVYGEEDLGNWSQFFYPFIVLLIMHALSSMVSGVVLVTEKRMSLVDRYTVAGVKFRHIVISTFIFESCVQIIQIGIIFTFLKYFFGMAIHGSWFLAILTVYLTCFGGMAFGILLSTLVNHEVEVIMINLFVMLMNLFSAGGLWPIVTVNPLYRTLCRLIPISLPLDTLRSIMHRGWGLEYFQVWRGLAISVLYGVFAIFLSRWVHNRK